MSTNTKLAIKSKSYADDKKTVTNTINYVNPNISNETALTLAQRFNALTKNSYQSTEKIETTEIDNVIKADRILTSSTLWSGSNQIAGTIDGFNITFNLPLSKIPTGNNQLDVWVYSNSFAEDTALPTISGDFYSLVSMTWTITRSRWSFVFAISEIKAQTINTQINIPENNTYKAATINITINITEG